ncbi:unnamed protein product [Nezara viridula]|uniref:Uncharacterized protein n=1 Tax=Nezara viridula TaxID=85310 RepID=A0A9P0MQ45_NEZVI|nr:unnamed protein product [Nezara viridula]
MILVDADHLGSTSGPPRPWESKSWTDRDGFDIDPILGPSDNEMVSLRGCRDVSSFRLPGQELEGIVVGTVFAAEVYTSKYDNIDVDKILSNDRILSQYIKCLMDEGNCTNEGRELKSE